RRQTLIDFADQIRLSRELVKLDCDTPLPEPVDDLAVRNPDPAVLQDFLETLEFRTLARRVSDAMAPGREAAVQAVVAEMQASGPQRPAHAPIDTNVYDCVRDVASLESWIARASAAGAVAFDTETDALSQSA